MSVRPSVRPYGTNHLPLDLHKIWYLRVFRKSVEKIHVSITSSITSHKNVCVLTVISRWILLGIRNVACKVVEKIKIHILCSATFLRKRCRVWNMWKNDTDHRQQQNTAHALCMLDN
jgi:hypothetical protein